MNAIKRYIPKSILLLFLLLLFIIIQYNSSININEFLSSIVNTKRDEISIIINIKYLTEKKHLLFSDFIKEMNATNNYYFIKTIDYQLENIDYLINDSFIKIVQSNFPDSFYLPLIVSIYGNSIPELVLFIDGDSLNEDNIINLKIWYNHSYKKLKKYNYDYIFGNYAFIDGKKIGCSLLLSKASIIQYLLYYTNSDTSHLNPFIQLSLANDTKFTFIKFNNLNALNLERIENKFSSNMICPSIEDKINPSFCILLPIFKRNYASLTFTAFSKQTYKPKFYVIIQNENRIKYNVSSIQKLVNEPIYHIWMVNWNSFFFLNHRLSSVFPCDFIIKYDDDQWPIDETTNQRLIEEAKNKNIIIGHRGSLIQRTFKGYQPKKYNEIEKDIVDHVATPMIFRPGYVKLDARNKIYRLYGGEDIALSLNSWKLCKVSSKKMELKLIQKHKDGNNHRADKEIINAYKNDKKIQINLFYMTYFYLILSGYVPRKWYNFPIPKKSHLNIIIPHKRLNYHKLYI